MKVTGQFGITDKFLTAGLAKQHELIYLPNKDIPIELPRNSQALFLVQRIRDEAHRFAITAHRKKRIRDRLVSRLDQIPGIGPNRKKALLTRFGSLDGVRRADGVELQEIRGITPELAATILEFLNP
jgi:excinuclease ABC subunit C